MKRWLVVFLVLILVFGLPGGAYARGLSDDKIVFGGTYTLSAGETLDGNLVMLAGTVTLEQDSLVDGDVVMLGGKITIHGRIYGDMVSLGGLVNLEETAVVEGDVVTFGAPLNKAEGAQVRGEVVSSGEFPLAGNLPQASLSFDQPSRWIGFSLSPLLEFIWFVARVLMWGLLALILVMLFEQPVQQVARVAIVQPGGAFGVGLLGLIVALIGIVVMIITILFIPVAVVVVIALIAAWIMGLVALGFELGSRLLQSLRLDWAPSIAAGMGTIVLLFVLIGFNKLVPCIGWLPQTLVGFWGFGAVLLTRFGTQPYPHDQVETQSQLPQHNGSTLPSVNEEESEEEITQSD